MLRFLLPRIRSAYIVLAMAMLTIGTVNADALEDLFVDTLSKADKGNSIAMYDLAGMYSKGIGTSKDINEALVWYQEAAQLGYAQASFKLGKIYSDAILIPKDSQKAFTWYKNAADQGHKKARNKVSAMYASGEGVTKDLDKAEEWSKPPKKEQPVEEVAAKTEKKAEKKEPVKKASSSTASKKKASDSTLDKVAASTWEKKKRDAVYLPSKTTHCNEDGGKLICMSKKIPAQELNKNYTYRIRSTLKNFTPDGHFDAEVKFQLVEVSKDDIEGYGEEDEDLPKATSNTIVQALKAKSDVVSCDLSSDKKSISCVSSKGRQTKFTK